MYGSLPRMPGFEEMLVHEERHLVAACADMFAPGGLSISRPGYVYLRPAAHTEGLGQLTPGRKAPYVLAA